MRVLYFIEGDGGGAVNHALALARLLPNKEIDTNVFFFLAGPSLKDADALHLNYRMVSRRSAIDPLLMWELLNSIQKDNIDILHTHTITGNFYARLACRISPRPLVCLTTVHSHVVDELKGKADISAKDRLMYLREMSTYRLADFFITVSDALKGRLMDSGVEEDKIEVIPNGVTVPNLSRQDECAAVIRREFGVDDGQILFTAVGRLVPLKNHDLFLDAARIVSGVLPNSKFLIVGDGPLRGHLEVKAKALGIADRTLFTGWRHDVRDILAATDIYVISSVVEGLNLSVLEAMANQIPVLGTRVKGIRELIEDDLTGLLVPSRNTLAMADCMTRLGRDDHLRERLGKAGRALVKKTYSVDRMVERTASLYRRVYNEVAR